MTQGRIQEVLTSLKRNLNQSVEETVPWFFENMHEYYFRSHSDDEVREQVQAIVSGQVTLQKQTVVLKRDSGNRVTFITPGTDQSVLPSILDQLGDREIQTARMYVSFDESLRLDTFHLAGDGRPERKLVHRMVGAMEKKNSFPEGSPPDFAVFLKRATRDYVEKFDPERAARHFALFQEMQSRESVVVTMETRPYPEEDRIIVAMNNPPRTGSLQGMVKVLLRSGQSILRMYADLFQGENGDKTLIMTAYVRHSGGLSDDLPAWERVKNDLGLLKWYHAGVLDRYADQRDWPLKKVSLLQAACKYASQILHQKFPDVHGSDRMARIVLQHTDVVELLMEYFRVRFQPGIADRQRAITTSIQTLEEGLACVAEGSDRSALEAIRDFFATILRTNYYKETPFGLSFRLDGAIMPEAAGAKPFGVYFFHGPAFQGFHVRYRDMARGGVRVVVTKTPEQYEIESKRLIHEVIGLASSQQRKNKDIPEGGAKAVLLLRPYGEIDLAVKSMTDSLLDQIVCDPESTCPAYVVDYLGGAQEIIYLGPDENISDDHIQWIVGRALKRGYPWARAIMSSKPRTGINHKEYGVTSLGVVVFMEEVLRTMGLNPREEVFSVKMTGGPAGDVAGNAMKILVREYGDAVRILAVTDGHGAAYDPRGLDHGELLRLVRTGKRIDAFDPGKLSRGEGFVISAADPEGARIRNRLHNTVRADIFLPAGGRPDTINSGNWKDFLDDQGRPMARAIVEGANLFVSDTARERLEEAGVMFLHGSSANKTGVITSSYEVLAGMLLTDEEFLEIKREYVRQVKAILEAKARAEARLILREHVYSGRKRPLTDISFAVSREINELGDRIASVLGDSVVNLHEDTALCEVLLSSCPPVLTERYADRIVDQLPRRYQFAVLGAHFSSRIVYSEGLGWLTRVSQVRDVVDILKSYLEQEKRVAGLLSTLRKSRLPDKEGMIRIIQAKGRKYLTADSLGIERD